MYGPVAGMTIVTADVTAPGMPSVNWSQPDNKIIKLDIVLPLADSDGSPLTGMKTLTVVSMAEPLGDGLGMDQVKALPGAVVLDVAIAPEDAGTVKSVEIQILNLGGPMSIYVACAD